MSKLTKWIVSLGLIAVVSGCATMDQGHNNSSNTTAGGNVTALDALKQPEKDGIKVEVEANAGGNYHIGDPIRFKINSSKEGKLWIVVVNSENNAELLFPHGDNSVNTISAGQEYLFPPRGSQQELYADKPVGKSALAFIVTGKDVDLSDIVVLKNGEMRNVSFGSDRQWGVAKLSINVEK